MRAAASIIDALQTGPGTLSSLELSAYDAGSCLDLSKARRAALPLENNSDRLVERRHLPPSRWVGLRFIAARSRVGTSVTRRAGAREEDGAAARGEGAFQVRVLIVADVHELAWPAVRAACGKPEGNSSRLRAGRGSRDPQVEAASCTRKPAFFSHEYNMLLPMSMPPVRPTTTGREAALAKKEATGCMRWFRRRL